MTMTTVDTRGCAPMMRHFRRLLLVACVCIGAEYTEAEHADPVQNLDAAGNVLHFETTHKMGSFLLRDKFIRNHYGDDKRDFKWRISTAVKERTVVVVRDLFDATVSGYLYHKDGQECQSAWLTTTRWQNDVWVAPYPSDFEPRPEPGQPHYRAANFVNLCQALNGTSETVGVGIYLEFARKNFYKSAVTLHAQHSDLALFLCYEDLLKDEVAAVRKMDAFFGIERERTNSKTNKHSHHSTSTDAALRARLGSIARSIDSELFNSSVYNWNQQLKCD